MRNEKSETVSVRLATEHDSREVFEWRNDDLTRRMSHRTQSVCWPQHTQWFSHALKQESRVLVICVLAYANASIAIVRFDIAALEAVISININPNYRGKGLATVCLEKSIAFFLLKKREVRTLIAEIKANNRASIKVFSSLGFTHYRNDKNVCFYQKKYD